MHDGRGIHGLAIAQGRLEPHLVGGNDGRFIQTVAQAANHAIYVQLPVRREHDFQQNFSLQLELARFLSVNRIRLEGDFHRCRCWSALKLLDVHAGLDCLLRHKARALHTTAIAAAISLSGWAIPLPKPALAMVPFIP